MAFRFPSLRLPWSRLRQQERRGGRWLALAPPIAAFLVGALTLPRAVAPRSLPVPLPDSRNILGGIVRDRARAAHARTVGLPEEVRVMGTRLRELHLAEGDLALRRAGPVHPALDSALVKLADDLQAATDRALTDAGAEPLLELRAVQAEGFSREISHFEATGDESAELVALGGPFLERMRNAGWLRGVAFTPPEGVRRVMYLTAWDAMTHTEARPEFQISVDDKRLLYAFYVSHPKRPRNEAWERKKLEELAAFDPAYPAGFARGVLEYRSGRFEKSAREFQGWLAEHPAGRYALLARNHLRAAMREEGDLP